MKMHNFQFIWPVLVVFKWSIIANACTIHSYTLRISQNFVSMDIQNTNIHRGRGMQPSKCAHKLSTSPTHRTFWTPSMEKKRLCGHTIDVFRVCRERGHSWERGSKKKNAPRQLSHTGQNMHCIFCKHHSHTCIHTFIRIAYTKYFRGS